MHNSESTNEEVRRMLEPLTEQERWKRDGKKNACDLSLSGLGCDYNCHDNWFFLSTLFAFPQIKAHFEMLESQPKPRHPIIEDVIGEDNNVEEAWELGYCDQIPKMK